MTAPTQCQAAYETFKKIFRQKGLVAVFRRVLALVGQTGANCWDAEISFYKTDNSLSLFGKDYLPFVFEGHSTDYQPSGNLKAMVHDGIAFLKVGLSFAFALRDALFALEKIEEELFSGSSAEISHFSEVLEATMIADPKFCKTHCHENLEQIRIARKYSYSDRACYYLNNLLVEKAMNLLIQNINRAKIAP